MQTIHTIPIEMPLHLGSVNCYLIETPTGFILIDTGTSNRRAFLEAELERLGCHIGKLKLILITHGDFDHTGNAAYLRQKYAVKIAMHADDAGMAEHADMFWNRKKRIPLVRMLAPIVVGFKRSDRFTPDITLEDGATLSEYGLDARVLALPGHSKGSIEVLTVDGALFCGDLLENISRPALSSIMDDSATAMASLEKLEKMELQVVCPGHGKPFALSEVFAK